MHHLRFATVAGLTALAAAPMGATEIATIRNQSKQTWTLGPDPVVREVLAVHWSTEAGGQRVGDLFTWAVGSQAMFTLKPGDEVHLCFAAGPEAGGNLKRQGFKLSDATGKRPASKEAQRGADLHLLDYPFVAPGKGSDKVWLACSRNLALALPGRFTVHGKVFEIQKDHYEAASAGGKAAKAPMGKAASGPAGSLDPVKQTAAAAAAMD